MNWAIKKDVEKITTSDGFWYELTDGGGIKPEEIINSPMQLRLFEMCLDVLLSFKYFLEDEEILEEI